MDKHVMAEEEAELASRLFVELVRTDEYLKLRTDTRLLAQSAFAKARVFMEVLAKELETRNA